MARARKEISPTTQKIILTLIRSGDSDRRVKAVTGVRPEEWRRLGTEDESFRTLLEKAVEERAGGLGKTLRVAMVNMIRKGHPWWAKLAIHNYATGLRDPDVVSGGKLKKMIDAIGRKNNTATEDYTADPTLASAEVPSGTIPGLAPSGEVQDDPRGTPERED